MKYGLLTYKYAKRDGYCPQSVNLGDYIQSIAARQFLPRVDVHVDRDSVAWYSGDPIKLIMNGWWNIYEGNGIASDVITPLYVSFHIDNPDLVTQNTIDFLKTREPIGCRDDSTLAFLESRGVDAYFSGCLTLTLGQSYRVSEKERTGNIYFVDFDFQFESVSLWEQMTSRGARNRARVLRVDRMNRILSQLVLPRDRGRIIRRTHEIPITTSCDDCFRIAEQYLTDYARAKLVVTTRIHCALPCLGMGVPVLFVKNHRSSRFGGLVDMMSHVGINECSDDAAQLFFCRYSTNRKNVTLETSGKHLEYVESLIKTCDHFIKL